jgi:2-C-methyl-D-erythritol 4-phosphate cytidylyltransferase
MERYAVIVAGGSGTRMGTSTPKQFLLLNGRPLLMYTIEAFAKSGCAGKIIVVLPQKETGMWQQLLETYRFNIEHKVVAGGMTRSESVRNGLKHVPNESLVAIHDGVRPLATDDLINRCFTEAMEFGNAIPAIPVVDSLRMVTGEKNKIADREAFRIIQTPQCFRAHLLKNAYDKVGSHNFSDDATVLEKDGHSIHLVEGERTNLKVTVMHDLMIASSILNAREK